MRSAEVIRQWTILRAIEASRHGLTIEQLADVGEVTTRTIRRDLEALNTAGFPVYDQAIEGRKRWKLEGRPFSKLVEHGLTLSEVCAIYFSRSLLETLAGAPFQSDLRTAFAKIEKALAPSMRTFLDRLPSILAAKPAAKAPRTSKGRDRIVSRVMEAVLHRRKARIDYWSLAHRRAKEYLVHPYRVVYGLGALYLSAYVEEYGETRTFALARVRRISLQEERFSEESSLDPFRHSLGIHQGPPVHVVIEFSADVAPFIKEREWHRSQQLAEGPDGGVRLTLDVCDDWTLRSWILGFGPRARVVAPATLAERIWADQEAAADRYMGRMAFASVDLQRQLQRLLPFYSDAAAS
jgi:predicted DNA-binding transcriptional regulator YafY